MYDYKVLVCYGVSGLKYLGTFIWTKPSNSGHNRFFSSIMADPYGTWLLKSILDPEINCLTFVYLNLCSAAEAGN